MTIAGLKLIVPSSVAGSGVSVSASGKVSFTSATSVSVNGCFSSSYVNYLVVMAYTATGTTGSNIRLRASGSDASTNYNTQYLSADGTSVTGSRITGTSLMRVGLDAAGRNAAHCYFYAPFLAEPTSMRSVMTSAYFSAYIEDYSNVHTASTSYDGFTFYPGSGNYTGSLTVYGLSE